jgi:hypothetical protein
VWYDGMAQAWTKVQGASMDNSPRSKGQRLMAWAQMKVPRVVKKVYGSGKLILPKVVLEMVDTVDENKTKQK